MENGCTLNQLQTPLLIYRKKFTLVEQVAKLPLSFGAADEWPDRVIQLVGGGSQHRQSFQIRVPSIDVGSDVESARY